MLAQRYDMLKSLASCYARNETIGRVEKNFQAKKAAQHLHSAATEQTYCPPSSLTRYQFFRNQLPNTERERLISSLMLVSSFAATATRRART